MNSRLSIERLGAQGDGIAQTERGPVFVPFTLPGEVVTAARARDRAELIAVLEASPLRVDPPCSHFGVCGGCSLQHMESVAYLAWKRAKVVDALKSRGIEAPVDEIVPCAPHSRRRVVLSARRTLGGMLLGYRRALSHEIVDILEDPISVPAIESALPRLRELAALIATGSQPFHLTVTATETGLDVAAMDSGAMPDVQRRAAAEFVLRERFARLSVDGEIVIEPQKPIIRFGGVEVFPPPGAFLQAVASAEETMAGLVLPHLAGSKKVADLFAGVGTFALRLARYAEVRAVEGDAAALAALDRGFRMATGLKRVTVEKRDLFRRPLTFKELNAFDGLVFDPPRAGAEDLARQIFRSDVPKVAAVSCNPTTLARDVGILMAGGYRLARVTPIDQFLWSVHVEAVALLEKPKRRR